MCVPVAGGGEHAQDDVPPMHPDDGASGLQQVEVEVRVSGHGAVEPGLQEGCPRLLQDPLGPNQVTLTHPGHPGHQHLDTHTHTEG